MSTAAAPTVILLASLARGEGSAVGQGEREG